MEDKHNNIQFSKEIIIVTVLIIAVMSFIGGVFVGGSSYYRRSFVSSQSFDFGSGNDTLNLDKMQYIIGLLNDYYVDPNKVDINKMSEGAIKGLVDSIGDPATYYLDPEETKEFNKDLAKASFEGIGAQLGFKDGVIAIISPLEGSPAQEAGIRPGDIIVGVDDTPITKNMSLEEVVNLIRGEAGTEVKLHVIHQGDNMPSTVSIIRNKIVVPNISLEIYDEDPSVAILHVYKFTDSSLGSWERDWSKAIDEFKKSGATKLVLDLRNNPGGFMNGAVYAAGEFLEKGSVVVKQSDRSGDILESKVNRTGDLLDIPLVVLVNAGSASASEILAGSLQYYKRAIVIGEKTFGKGTAQEIKPLSDGSSLHITLYKWLLPDERNISHENPIVPDYEVNYTNDDFKKGIDPQLEKAIEILKNK